MYKTLLDFVLLSLSLTHTYALSRSRSLALALALSPSPSPPLSLAVPPVRVPARPGSGAPRFLPRPSAGVWCRTGRGSGRRRGSCGWRCQAQAAAGQRRHGPVCRVGGIRSQLGTGLLKGRSPAVPRLAVVPIHVNMEMGRTDEDSCFGGFKGSTLLIHRSFLFLVVDVVIRSQ
jgi:hypothetical protein